MTERSDRSRSPKRVKGEPETAWPGLRASLDRVHEAVQALLSRGEAETNYLSNAQRLQLKEHLDRIAEDALQLVQPKVDDEAISEPAQFGVVKFNRTESQAAGQKRIEYVRSQFDECQVPMTKLVRSVSLLVKDPVPSDAGRLREALTIVERGQKQARNYGEDLLKFMVDLDNISGLLDEDRNFRRSTMRRIDALLANIDDARSRLVVLHRILDKELKTWQEQGVQLADIASEEPQSKDASQLLQEARPAVLKIDSHAALRETASLRRKHSELSGERHVPDEHQVPMSKLARSASLIQEVDTLLSNIEKASKEPAHQNKVPAKCAKVDRGGDSAARLRSQEEQEQKVAEEEARHTEVKEQERQKTAEEEAKRNEAEGQARQKAAEEEARRNEAVGKTWTSTQPSLVVPSGPPTIFAPRSAASYARMAF